MKVRKEYTCPLEIVHDMIKGKWKTIIIYQISQRRVSLSELQKEIKGITQKMLIEQLKELRAFELVDKKVYDGYPLKVEYFLTDRGMKMLSAINIMQDIGVDYMLDNDLHHILDEKGIAYQGTDKKVGNVQG